MSGSVVRVQAFLLLLALLPLTAAPGNDQLPSHPEPPDAIIEEWHQRWTLNADGSTVYQERKRVRLNNDRAYGDFTDPRITFDKDTESVEVVMAHVLTPRGATIDTPPYSKNEVAPSGPAGWPAFAGLRQLVLTLSGIEPGCSTEVEYIITSKPERRTHLTADLRLDGRYPITLRTVTVEVPVDAALAPVLSGLPERAYTYAAKSENRSGRGALAHRWEFLGLPAAVDEPQSPPWQSRSPRLCFTTADPETWIADTLTRLNDSSEATVETTRATQQWAADAVGDDARLRAIQKRFADTFTVVDFDPSWRPARLRSAGEVFASSYGTPEEALSVFLCLTGREARSGLLVSDEAWSAAAPQPGAVAAYVAVVVLPGGPQVWHPQYGRIERDARWAGHTLYCRMDDDSLLTAPLPRFSAPTESAVSLQARIKIAPDGSYSGSAAFAVSGLFMPGGLAGDTGRQRDRVRDLLSHVLPKLKVESLRVAALAPAEAQLSDGTSARWTTGGFSGEANIASDGPLEKSGDRFALLLATDGPHTVNVAWPPLARSRRQTPVRLVGPFEENIELTIEWPAGWKLEAQPADAIAATGDWGAVSQRATVDGAKLSLRRAIRISAADLAPAAFHAARDILNQLRTESARLLLLKP